MLVYWKSRNADRGVLYSSGERQTVSIRLHCSKCYWNNSKSGINSCDIAFTDDLKAFLHEYDTLTEKVAAECKSTFLEDHMIVGTSAMIQTELDSIVNQYTDKFCNPMVMWGKYRKHWFKTTLPISFQFHHTQMDGAHAGKFLANLQNEINRLA